MFENTELRRMFARKKEEVTLGLKILKTNFYSSPTCC
jgi:hypothetical protein